MQVLSDAEWAKFEAAIVAANIRGARPRVEDRRTIEAIIWRIDNSAKWRAIPAELATGIMPIYVFKPIRIFSDEHLAFIERQNPLVLPIWHRTPCRYVQQLEAGSLNRLEYPPCKHSRCALNVIQCGIPTRKLCCKSDNDVLLNRVSSCDLARHTQHFN